MQQIKGYAANLITFVSVIIYKYLAVLSWVKSELRQDDWIMSQAPADDPVTFSGLCSSPRLSRSIVMCKKRQTVFAKKKIHQHLQKKFL